MAEHTPNLDICVGRCNQSHNTTPFGVGGRSCVCVYPKPEWRRPQSPPAWRTDSNAPSTWRWTLPFPSFRLQPKPRSVMWFPFGDDGRIPVGPQQVAKVKSKPLVPCLPQTFTEIGKVSGPPYIPAFISEQGSDGRLGTWMVSRT